MLNDNIKITGDVVLSVFGPDGQLKEKREIKNLVVTSGKDFIASRMKDATATVMSHFAIGTDGTAPVVGNTALGAEVGRVALGGTVVSGSQVIYSATVPAGTGTGAIVEAGIFNASSAGTMLCRTTFAVINKGAADSLAATWTITVS